MINASVPIQRAPDAKLLVVDENGAVTHHARAAFPNLVREGDIVVANDAATLPASLSAFICRQEAPSNCGSRREIRCRLNA